MTHFIRFIHPGYLLLLLIVIPAIFYIFRKRNPRPPKLSLVLKTSSAVLLILAISGLQVAEGKRNTAVVFVVDRSQSVAPIDKSGILENISGIVSNLSQEDEAGVVVFGKEAVIEHRLQKNLKISDIQSTPAAAGTNISKGLSLARSMLASKPEFSRHIVLFSDGNQTSGDALKEAAISAMEGITIDSAPLATAAESSGRRLFLYECNGPESVRLDEPFEIEISLRGSKGMDANLQVFRDSAIVSTRRQQLSGDLETFIISDQIRTPGFHHYQVKIQGTDKSRPDDNDESGCIVYAHGRTRVLHVADRPNGFLTQILKNQGFELVRSDSRSAPKTLQDFSPYDAIILDNVPVSAFSEDQMRALAEHTERYAGGLIMIGGSGSFGPGGYSGTPVEKALPVDMALRSREKKPALALMLVLDKSGSMGMEQRKISKLDMAKEAVLQLSEMLNSGDTLGIIAFDRSPQEVRQLGGGVDRASISGSLRTISAGGGTAILPAVEMAYDRLNSSPAEKKHILLLSDGQADQAERKPLAARVAGSNVVFSTVGVGADVDRALMQKLAESAHGRAYFTDTGMDLPEIFKREGMLISGKWLVERTFVPHQQAEHEVLRSLGTSGFPAMSGYVAVTPKKLSEIPLVADNEDPILVCGRYGLGKTLTFMSDLSSPWTQQFVQWQHFASLWAQMVRWAARGVQSDVLHAQIKAEDESAIVSVDAYDPNGEFLNYLNVGARLESPDSTGSDIAMAQTASGRYEGQFPLRERGAYLLAISATGSALSSESTLHLGFDASKFSEDHQLAANEPFMQKLAEAAKGKVMKQGREYITENTRPSYKNAWQLLAIATLLLFAFDLFWNRRRRSVGYSI
jgi:uncharacterized membrane protein